MAFYAPPSSSDVAAAEEQVNQLPNTTYNDPAWAGTDVYSGPDYSGSDGGGGDVGVAAAPVTKPLASSPEWLAYLNALGLERSQFEADINRQRTGIGADTQRQLANLVPSFNAQRRGITGSLESRGMASSGELLRKLAENRANQGIAAGNIQAAGANQLSTLESQLAQKISDIGSRQSQEELTLRSQGYT